MGQATFPSVRLSTPTHSAAPATSPTMVLSTTDRTDSLRTGPRHTSLTTTAIADPA